MKELKDKYNRRHNYLRISLTDKCNLNCLYCNPSGNDEIAGGKANILSFEEIERIIRIFVQSGFDKFRFTGGEPLARKGIANLLGMILPVKNENHFELSMTTNALLLDSHIDSLKANGLDRLNISLDSLKRETFRLITGFDYLDRVIRAILKAKDAGFEVKINTVVLKGINDSELIDFCRFSEDNNLNVRFIEFMPFSNNGWTSGRYLSSEDMKQVIQEEFDIKRTEAGSGLADVYEIQGSKAKISFINSISDHFCAGCNRLRLTSDGKLKLCLFSPEDELLDIKSMMKEMNDQDLVDSVASHLELKKSGHPPLGEIISLKNNNMLKIGG